MATHLKLSDSQIQYLYTLVDKEINMTGPDEHGFYAIEGREARYLTESQIIDLHSKLQDLDSRL